MTNHDYMQIIDKEREYIFDEDIKSLDDQLQSIMDKVINTTNKLFNVKY